MIMRDFMTNQRYQTKEIVSIIINHRPSSCLEKNSSILSLLKSGPAYSPSFSMDTLRYQSHIPTVAKETISKQNNTRPVHVPLETPGYHDNSYSPVNLETIEREPRGRAYTMGIIERKDDSEYLPSVPHRTRSNTGSSVSVLQKSHKRLSDLLTGPSSLLSPKASPTPEKQAEIPKSSLSKSGSVKSSKPNSALLQRLLTIGPSVYVRHGPVSETETKETAVENTSNGSGNMKQNNASSALLTLLRGRKQNEIEEKTENRLDMQAELQERLKLSVPHQNPERKTTGKLDATIEKLSSMLVDKVIQAKSSETELPPLQVPSPSIETRQQESPRPVAKEQQPERPSLLKALVKEKIYKEQEKVEREAFLLETLKRSLAEPREELLAHLPFPGKDFMNFYKCEHCGKGFPHKGTLKVHMRTHSMEKQEFKCDVCGKVCSAKGYLLIHMRTHRQEYGPSQEEELPPTRDENPPPSQKTVEEMNGCSICGKTFSESENLLIHLRMHSGEKLYKCEVCGNGFTRKTQLAIHMRIHTGEKPYECEVCGKTFRQSNGLNLHMITHSEVKPYNCQSCGAGFGRKAHYEKHMRWHRGERPFNCAVCGKGFTDKFNLSTHFKIHKQKKDHVCDVCGKGYNQATHLKNHMQFHAGERGYQCSDCDSLFEHKRTLQNHIKCTHFDTYEKSLTSKTSLRKFQKLRAHGQIVENTFEQDQSSESSSDDSNYDDDNDDSMLSDGDDTYSGEDKFVIKNEPGDWYSDYTGDTVQPDKCLESSYDDVGQTGEGEEQAGEGVGQAGEGVGPTDEGVGQAGEGVEQTGEGVEQTGEGVGQAGEGVEQAGEGVGPAGEGVGRTGEGVGPTGEGVGQVSEGVGQNISLGEGNNPSTGSSDDRHCENWNGLRTSHIKQEVVDVYPGEMEPNFNDKSQGQSPDNLQSVNASEKENSDRDIHTQVLTVSVDGTVVKTEPNDDEIVQGTAIENTDDSLNYDDLQSKRIQHSFERSETSYLNYVTDHSNKRTIQLDLSVSSTYEGERREFNGISNHDSSDSEQDDRFYIGKKFLPENGEMSPVKKRRISPESPEPLKIEGDESSSKGDNPDGLPLHTANR
ncbi:uncharacterized protein LOC117315282 [Pecten maximus]|uniref:uncharacterized protein LOC117315282 n=1 Tax=Pecten maximus TaxID=6579 RepID=UPI001458DFA7|nr:uncharacterized protein LOC117315282 [Pecten maximus]